MCLGIPGVVLGFDAERPEMAEVDVRGTRRQVHLGMLEGEELRVGDWVLMHLGFALSRVEPDDVPQVLALLDDLDPAGAQGIDGRAS